MKRKLLYFILFAIFPALAYSQYVEDTITINRVVEAPIIDGYMDEGEWDTEGFYEITEWGEDEFDQPHAPDPADCTAKYKLLWDDEFIYFLGFTVDDYVSEKSDLVAAGAPAWENDSWEFYIAPTLSKLESMEEMTQIRWSYATVDIENGTDEVTQGWSSFGDWPGYGFGDFAFARRNLTVEGWLVEAKLELALIAAKVDDIDTYAAGDVMGWQITVSDNDGEEARDWIGNWIPDTQWDHADTLGILKLGSELSGTVGIDKPQTAEQISIYPNPVAKEFHVKGDTKIEALEIFNAVGAMVLRINKVEDQVEVSNLHTGLYFVKVYSNGSLLETLKLVKE